MDEYREGQLIRHGHWGVGRIESVHVYEGATILEVHFADGVRRVTVGPEVEALSDADARLVQVLRYAARLAQDDAHESGPVPEMAEKYRGGTLVLRPAKADLKPYELPIDAFWHKVVLLRDRLRVLEQKVNSSERLADDEKVAMQGYITRCYGSLTSFNVLFRAREEGFVGGASHSSESES